MTRKATLGVLVVAVMLVTTGLAAVGSAAATDAGDAAATSSAPLAQETTEEEENESETSDETEMGNESEGDRNASASVTIQDQSSNGTVVSVNEANLSQGGFLVILNSSSQVIGNSSYLEEGTHENVTVQFDTPLNESGVVVAVPHLDTNDNRTFDYNATMAEEIGPANATDGPYLEDGAPGGATAYVTVGNETTSRSMDVPRADP